MKNSPRALHRVTALLLCTLVAMLITTTPARAQEAPAEQQSADALRPKFNVLRFKENWKPFGQADPATFTHPLDPIKYIPLTDDENIWVSFGGQARMRLEYWDDFNHGVTGAADDDDLYGLWRFFAHADLHVGDHLRFFIEGKSASASDRDLPGGRRTLEADSIALQNGFAELSLPLDGDMTLTVRGGRQELLLGAQRLVSPLDWSNTRRTFDGVWAELAIAPARITAFWTRPVVIEKYHNNKPDQDSAFFGVHFAMPLRGEELAMESYFYGLHRDDITSTTVLNGTTGDEHRYTFGGRLHGKFAGAWDYDIEGAYQTGTVDSADINAFMIGSQVGVTFADVWSTPRVFAGFDYASGDDSAGGDVETFNQLFPLGHAYLGFIDQIGRQNIIAPSVGVVIKPTSKLTALLQGFAFWRASDDDGLYNAGGARIRAPGTDLSQWVGGELDLLVKYQWTRHTQFLAGYSHFFAGKFIDQTGTDDDIDFVYLSIQHTF